MARGVGAPPLLLPASPPLLMLLVLLLLSSSRALVRSARGGDLLTEGFTAVELAEAQFVVQKPYDVPLAERYELVDGVRRMWVYATDKPITTARPGGPRTETKIELIYSSGVWQFEGYGYIPCGTSGASVMQIFGAAEHATTLMLHVYDGRLTYYHDEARVVGAGVYDRWFRLNVVPRDTSYVLNRSRDISSLLQSGESVDPILEGDTVDYKKKKTTLLEGATSRSVFLPHLIIGSCSAFVPHDCALFQETTESLCDF